MTCHVLVPKYVEAFKEEVPALLLLMPAYREVVARGLKNASRYGIQ